MARTVLLIAALLLVNAYAGVVVERVPGAAPKGWKQVERASKHERVSLIVVLHARNSELLVDNLLAVSDPQSPRYGHHLTQDEVTAIVAAPDAAIDAVVGWLSAVVPEAEVEVHAHRHAIRVQTTVAGAERLLGGTAYHRYINTVAEVAVIRSVTQYTVPAFVAKYIAFVGGVHRFPGTIKADKPAPAESSSTSSSSVVDPAFIKSQYNITATGHAPGNLQAVAQFLGQYMDPTDLKKFQEHFKLPVVAVNAIVGPNQANNPGTEASLDIQYITAIGEGIATQFWSTGGEHQGQEPFLEFLFNVGNATTKPNLFSISYGDVEESLNHQYMEYVNNNFAILGSKGITIIYASGDDGTGSYDHCKTFAPNFPASSPWVTSVGGTSPSSGGVEVGVGFSSGGFSFVFAQPSYQSAAVAEFLKGDNLPPAKLYNASGRAFPDISALAVNFEIYVGGSLGPVDGTSCASPTAAGVMSLLNDYRLQNGKSTLGFLNPMLYQNPTALTDITSGSNQASGCKEGFSATAGWDAITGLGTPNYYNLLEVVKKLP